MFVGLIQRCEQIAMPTMTLSQAMEVFDERFYGLPNLIDALQAIIVEMPTVRTSQEPNSFFSTLYFHLSDWRRISWSIRTFNRDDY